jgi:fermentation-respiration switch protein FrsA (DUF1100 family)
MLKLALFFVFSLVAIALVIRQIESRFIFFPTKGVPAVADNAVSYEDVFFKTADGKKLHGWFISSGTAAASSVVLFLHGNAGNIGHRWEKIQILHDLGVSVFIFDYRGYGRSEGSPSETGLYKDTETAYGYLIGRGIPAEKIIVYGESIGGAFAVDLSARKPVKALILEDTFTSVPAMARKVMPMIPGFILATRLDSLSKVGKVSAPKLIFHSVDDEIVPFEMGNELFAAAAEPKWFVRLRGGHNTAFLDDIQTYRNGLSMFLRVDAESLPAQR